MINKALLIGNTQYKSLAELPCCHYDLLAMKELLEHAQKYNHIEIIEKAYPFGSGHTLYGDRAVSMV